MRVADYFLFLHFKDQPQPSIIEGAGSSGKSKVSIQIEWKWTWTFDIRFLPRLGMHDPLWLQMFVMSLKLSSYPVYKQKQTNKQTNWI